VDHLTARNFWVLCHNLAGFIIPPVCVPSNTRVAFSVEQPTPSTDPPRWTFVLLTNCGQNFLNVRNRQVRIGSHEQPSEACTIPEIPNVNG
jgi:hypothetical protein